MLTLKEAVAKYKEASLNCRTTAHDAALGKATEEEYVRAIDALDAAVCDVALASWSSTLAEVDRLLGLEKAGGQE